MNREISSRIEGWRDEFTETLRRWVQVPSVKGAPEENAPFGREVRRALDTAMETAAEMGFEARDYDGYACDLTLGHAEEEIAVLGHLDVVPAGDGWTVPPFEGLVKDGRIYGRGTNDDKGPSLAALFAMRAIRDAGVPLRRTIRLILGCDEESGWQDMEYYRAHAKLPETGFSPDAAFPLINTEKGMVHLRLTAADAPGKLKVLRMQTGDRLNVIPGESRALLQGGEELAEKVRAFAAESGLDLKAEVTEEGVWVTAAGIPGHSAYPEGRRNAIGMMLKLFEALGAEGPLKTLAGAVGMEHDGTHLGCAVSDEVSGALTCNMGILRLENGQWTGTLDFRCPVMADLNRIRQNAVESLPGWNAETLEIKAPHHVPADSGLVRALLAAYQEETGWEAKPMSTGGGTYARVLRQGVAFGALFPDEEDLAHQADEYESIDRLILAAKIYANALIRLAAEE